MSHYHVKKGKLTRGAFDAPAEHDEVSVSRNRYVDPWIAKAYAKKWVVRPGIKPAKLYEGLAFITVENVTGLRSTVIDSRSEYLGHADISHGIVKPKGQALRPDIRKALEDRLEEMAKQATYVADPVPDKRKWLG